MKFEDTIKRIEEISELLENDELSLDDMIKYYEEGTKLTKEAKQYLEQTELKIKQISNSKITDFSE